jgi:type II secretory pathway pseudopilin PulG
MGAPDDRGESLLELLVAVTIMGVAVVAMVGGIGTGILMSDIHRKQATAGAYVRDYAEAIENTVSGSATPATCATTTPATCYAPCATTARYASPAGFSAPPGYAWSIVSGSMRYWSGSGWQPACPATGDTGLQKFTVQVASADGRANERVVVVLRRPCRLTESLCG